MKNILYVLVVAAVFALNGCGGSNSGGGAGLASGEVSKLSDFGPHGFNHKVYLRGMSKAAHHTYYWQNPDAHLGDFHFVKIEEPTDKYLPINVKFDHEQYIEKIDTLFKSNLNLKESSSKQVLRLQTALVECNPGNRAARHFVGIMGAGKAVVTIVVEVYEPGKTTPSLKIYARDSASRGGYHDSSSLIGQVLPVMVKRVATVLEGRIDIEKTGRTGKEI